MTRNTANSSSSASSYFWSECGPYDDGAGKSGRPSTGLLILFTTYCFEFLVGAPSNLWLTCHILRQRSKVIGVLPADLVPLCLALTQLLFYLVLPAFLANHYVWQSNDVLFMVSFLNSIILIMKPLLLCLVCVEKYVAVVRPLDYLRFKACRYRWGCLGVTSCIYVVVASFAVFKRTTVTLCMLFLTVLVIDTFCSLSILKTLKKTPPGDRGVEEEMEGKEGGETKGRKRGMVVGRSKMRGNGEMNSMKRKAFVIIVIIQAVLTLNYLPMILTLPMEGFVPAWELKCQFVALGLAAAAGCSYLQPLLYLHRRRKLPCMKTQNT